MARLRQHAAAPPEGALAAEEKNAAPHSAQRAGPRGPRPPRPRAAPASRLPTASSARAGSCVVHSPAVLGGPGAAAAPHGFGVQGLGRPGVSALRDAGSDSGRGRLARQSPRGQAARDGVPLAEPTLCPGFLSRLPRPREVGVVDQVQTTEASRSPRRGQTRRAPGHIPGALSLPAPAPILLTPYAELLPKESSTSGAIREARIKTTTRYHFTPSRVATTAKVCQVWVRRRRN